MILDITENKETFIEIAKNNIERDGIDGLMDYLINKSDFFTAPCSTVYHLSIPGGLCRHSLNVYNRLISEIENEYGTINKSPYTLETITIVSLFHDLCKVDYYETFKRNVKNEETGKWEQVDSYKVNDKLPIPHSFKSQYIVRSYINLTREESIAIMSHMGAFDNSVKGGDYTICEAMRKFTLATLLHVADLKSTYIDEKETYQNG